MLKAGKIQNKNGRKYKIVAGLGNEGFSGVFQEFNKKLMKNVPLWMALSVIAMVGLGFLTGGAAANVFMIHFSIGCGIALIIWFCFWQQARSVSMDKVRVAGEKAGERRKKFSIWKTGSSTNKP